MLAVFLLGFQGALSSYRSGMLLVEAEDPMIDAGYYGEVEPAITEKLTGYYGSNGRSS